MSGVVSSGDTRDVSSSQVDSGTLDEGFVWIENGGIAQDIVVNSVAGSSGSISGLDVKSGGTVDGATVDNGAVYVADWNYSTGSPSAGAGGGTVNDAIVNSGGAVIVFSGGAVHDVVVNSGGALEVDDSSLPAPLRADIDGVANSGAYVGGLIVSAGSVASGLPGGGFTLDGLTVSSGAFWNDLTVSSGGVAKGIVTAAVPSAGTITADPLPNVDDPFGYFNNLPTTIIVQSDGLASGTVVSAQGALLVSSGGIASNTTVDAGGSLKALPGGVIAGGVVNSGGAIFESVMSGITASGLAGGAFVVDGLTVLSGAEWLLAIQSGGIASGLVVGDVSGPNSAPLYVYSGGVASGTLVSGGNLDIFSSGLGMGTVVSSGGWDYVWSGGVESNGTIDPGGSEDILAGGLAKGMTVSSGGYQYDTGSATGTVITDAGWEYLSSGGRDSGTVVSSGGFQDIFATGVASNTNVKSGGWEYVWSGGVASAPVISSGGYDLVFSSGTISGATLSGGTIELQSGGRANGVITFTGAGGTLKLDSAGTLGANISGFGVNLQDGIDFSNIGFGQGTTVSFTEALSNTSGTLVVSDGTHTDTVELLGSYTSGNFSSSSDGGNGTLVVDPPVAATGTLSHPGQQDWFAVSLSANQGYEITVSGLSSEAAVYVGSSEALSPGGVAEGANYQSGSLSAFASDVSAGGNVVSNFTGIIISNQAGYDYTYFMPKESGTYYIDVGAAGLTSATKYTVSVAAVPSDYTDNPTAPGSLVVNGPTLMGMLQNGGQQDWIAVSLVANQAYDFNVGSPGNGGSFTVGLSNTIPPGDVVSGSSFGGSSFGPIINYYFMPDTTGTYYVDIGNQQSLV